MTAKHKYDESSIKHLEPLEHIRKRPGMYIGKLGNGSAADDGIYVLLKEVLDNTIDEFRMKCGKTVLIDIGESGETGQEVKIQDFGRGIPLGALVDCVSKIGRYEWCRYKSSKRTKRQIYSHVSEGRKNQVSIF
jgi:topoisomerase IV subunit B